MSTPKLPDHIKKARGTYRKDRSNPNAPKVEAAVIGPPPAGLRRDEKAIWERLAVVLNPMHVVAVSDLMFLELAVMALGLALRTAANPKASPNQKIRTAQHAASMVRELGLTPPSRAKVAAVPHEMKGNELAEFLTSTPWTPGN